MMNSRDGSDYLPSVCFTNLSPQPTHQIGIKPFIVFLLEYLASMLIKNNNKLNSYNIFIFTTFPVSYISPPAFSVQWERAFQADTRPGAGIPNMRMFVCNIISGAAAPESEKTDVQQGRVLLVCFCSSCFGFEALLTRQICSTKTPYFNLHMCHFD